MAPRRNGFRENTKFWAANAIDMRPPSTVFCTLFLQCRIVNPDFQTCLRDMTSVAKHTHKTSLKWEKASREVAA